MFLGLIALLLAHAPAQAKPLPAVAEWQFYQGLGSPTDITITPDKGYSIIHVDEFDYAINTNSPDDFQLILTYNFTDGTTATSPLTIVDNGVNVFFTQYPYAYWVPAPPTLPNRKAIKSIGLTLGNPTGNGTFILQLHGTESN